MKIKKGVSLNGLTTQILLALFIAERVWDEYGQELVITAGSEGKHSVDSLHYSGNAVDLRTRYFYNPEQIKEVARVLRIKLGTDFDVVVHKTHIHIEYQPRYKESN